MKNLKFNLIIPAIVSAVILQACINRSLNNPLLNMDQLQVPSDFNWESSRVVGICISSDLLAAEIGSITTVSVWDGDPVKKSNQLLIGAAGYESPFTTELKVPTALKRIYLKAVDVSGFETIDSVEVSDQINYTFGQAQTRGFKATTADPDCSAATAAKTLTGNNIYNISNNTNYYVTGDFSGTVNFSGTGGTITVCGYMHPQSITGMNATCNIVVTQGGTFHYGNILAMGTNSRIYAYSNTHVYLEGVTMNSSRIWSTCNDFIINSSFSPSGGVENYGAMTIGNDLTIGTDASTFVTTGSMTVNGNLNLTYQFTNNGPMEIFGSLNLNGGTLYHNCKLIVHQNLNLSSGNLTLNGAYLRESQMVQVNPGATLLLKNGSMISTLDYEQNTNVSATGGGSVIKISNTGSISGQNQLSGSVNMVTPLGTLITGNSSNFLNGAKISSAAAYTGYIAVTSCNPEGIGKSAHPADSDGDGVPDALDNYPNDPIRAFNNYYPSKAVFGSVAFEDLWPLKGDYDMNDLIVDYRYNLVTNVQNSVVDILPEFYVRAAGAKENNGFGVQFDNIASGQVASVTGCSVKNSLVSIASNGVETGQEKAVIIPFDNFNNVVHRPSGYNSGFFNTDPGIPRGYGDTLKIFIHLNSPIPSASMGLPPFNPFLIKDRVRKTEVHLVDHLPTSLADRSDLGTGDDNSNPATGNYYKTSKNLPFALDIPVKFEYTIEKTPVIQGYNFFSSWSQSKGIQYADWYNDNQGYRVKSRIFK